MPPSKAAASWVPPLLAWFSQQARDLPWRRTQDPYGIWISEIMLQQTQVKTVIPYWTRWMEALPTVLDLANAEESRVLKLWAGLGYYTRARNLRAAAHQVVTQHQGRFPQQVAGLLELPGIGRYTAGAIASIAFNQPAPLLDGNVIRVLTRWHSWSGDPRSKDLNATLWNWAETLVRAAQSHPPVQVPWNSKLGACSALNQALMELGALICTPRAPQCLLCPVQSRCSAGQNGNPEAYPESAARPSITARTFVVAVLEREGQVLLRQRPAGGVNAGFWEFPNLEIPADHPHPRAAAAEWLGVPARQLEALPQVKHAITRYRILLEVFHLIPGPKVATQHLGTDWVSDPELHTRTLTTAHGRIARNWRARKAP